MSLSKKLSTPKLDFLFADTSFDKLMQHRIINVLLVCSNYDAFMLEEDGRIDEQIFTEYVSLNLRYPPKFTQVSTREEAFEYLNERPYDLIIMMLSIDKHDTIGIANEIKSKHQDIPIVLLTHFTRKVTEKIENENLTSIDYVFCWLNNSSLLMAIVKLLEDKMNAEQDINNIGTQCIILVEDSIRYYSSYLPNIYRILLQQSETLTTDGLNHHQKTMRKRGRPKMLLASNLEDAIDLYEKYQHNLLGIISDISFKNNGVQDPTAGIKFCKIVKEKDASIPFVLQSSDIEHRETANKLGAHFLDKYSKTLIPELTEYLKEQFLFGDFLFKDPKTNKIINKASDLKSLQQVIMQIPDESVIFHASNNHFSKWLKTRSMFSLARLMEKQKCSDFDNIFLTKKFIFETIARYRVTKSRGQIAKFDKDKFDNYIVFSRIGDGSLGGKARGLAFIDTILKRNKIINKFDDVVITIPNTVVICTDVFDEFMNKNNLYKVALSDISDEEILNHFISGKLPKRVLSELRSYVENTQKPIAVRSSSLLEDSFYQPFAGIYSTYLIPNNDPDPITRRRELYHAIKSVWASVFYKESKAYMTATSSMIDEEKMGVVLQEVTGTDYGSLYYPSLSGVARSHNFYPIEAENSKDGVANIAFGLGKTIVDGGTTLRFSPKYPKKIIQLSSTEYAIKDAQKEFYAINLGAKSYKPNVDEGANLLKLPIANAENDQALHMAISVLNRQNYTLSPGSNENGLRVVTFDNILKYNSFPLADILSNLLETGEKEMSCPVEIEFAVNFNVPKGEPKQFNFLQIRPIVHGSESIELNLNEIKESETILISKKCLGNGSFTDIYDFIYVKPDSFDASKTQQIADEIGIINNKLISEKRKCILVGPGRWGSSDPWLGIPVKWSQISGAQLITESGLNNFRIEPSQGTHFFQNLTSLGMGYFTINPYINDGFYDITYLDSNSCIFENQFIRHIRFENPLQIKIDGRKGIGVIFKP